MPYFQILIAVLAVFSFLTVSSGSETATAEKPTAKKSATKKSKKTKVKKPVADNGMYVEAIDPNVDLSGFKDLGYQVVEPRKEPDTSRVPTATRDQLFAEAGMNDEVAGWDNFERDVFTMRSEVQPFERMRGWYPQISDKKLKAHQALVTKWRNSK